MTQLPSCVQYIQALGPSFVAIVAGVFGGYIAYRQWRTGHHRLRLDMFEKRFAVYEATKNLINAVTSHGGVIPEDLGAFYNGVRGAEFLFDGETRDFVVKIGEMGFKARMARVRRERSDHHPRADELIDEEEEILKFLRDQDARLETMFSPYLDLSKVGL
jgi:hypothetical protein